MSGNIAIYCNMANQQIGLMFIPTSRGGRYLCLGGYMFRRRSKRDAASWTSWKCIDKNCTSSVSTVDDILTKHPSQHNHAPVHDEITIRKTCLKTKAKTCLTAMPTLYNEEVSSLVDGPWTEENRSLVASMPTYDTVKKRLYKARWSTFPAIPTTRRDILIPDEYKTTDAGEPFVIINDGEDNKILGMTTTSNLEHLCAADVIYGDGTFYVAPSLFLQLYTLHAMVGGQMFPLVFFLLPNKTKKTYNRAFRLLKEAAVARGMQLLPQCVQMDYELAAKAAVANNFPTATWKGCLFHYTQCIWRKTQAVGLQTVYNHDEEVTRFVRRAAVLPLVPEGRVEDVWLNALADMPDDPRCLQLADYVTTYWIEGDVPLATPDHRPQD